MGLTGLLLAGGVSAQQELPTTPPLRIAVEVSEPAGVTRWSAPVQLGVPLPRGAPATAAAFRVLDETGIEIPADRWVIARWNGPVDRVDLPIRWLGVRFATDLAARSSRQFVVVAEPSVAESSTPLARVTEDGILINTGPVEFRIPSAGTSVIDGLRIDMDGVEGADAELVAADHSGGIMVPTSAGTPGRWQTAATHVLENGQFAATVRVDLVPNDGSRGPIALTIRATHGSPVVRLRVDATRTSPEPVSLVLPIQTLGDPLELGVRRGFTESPLQGPLPREGTLIVRPGAEGWTGTLGTIEAPGLVPWAQMSTLTWSAAITAPEPRNVDEFKVSGNGVLWANLAGGQAADLGLEIRRRMAEERVAEAFAPAVHAAVEPEALWRAEAFGPAPVASALAASAATGTLVDSALGAVLTYATAGDAVSLASVKIDPEAPGLGTVLLARLRADTAALAELTSSASGLVVAADPAAQAERAMQAWDVTGQRGHLEHARALLRTAIGSAWSSDICRVAAERSTGTATLIQTTGTYAWVRRAIGETDQAAENAIFGILDRLQTCVPSGPEWSPAWAFGGALFEESQEGQRWLALAAAGAGDVRLGQ